MGRTFLVRELRRLLREVRNEPQSRRDFLRNSIRTGGALAGLSVLPDFARAAMKSESPIAILGGGIAGLTAAFYLTRAGYPCEIYEAAPRLGGRIFTFNNFNGEGMTCELGGELVDSNHKDLIALCKFFGIHLDDFTSGDKGLEPNLYFFPDLPGGQRHLYKDKDALAALAALDRKFRHDVKAIDSPQGLKKIDSMTLTEYLDSCRNYTEPWFLEMLRVAYVGEMGLEADEQSALNIVWTLLPDTDQLELFGDSDQAKRIRGGNSSIIRALHKWLQERQVPLKTGARLSAIRAKTSDLELTFDGAATTVVAKRVICTIPFSQLRKVDGIFALSLTQDKQTLIREMRYGTGGKLMLGFTDRYWRKGHPRSNGMVYTDLHVQNVWETSRMQPGSSGILTAYMGGINGAAVDLSQAPRALNEIEGFFPGSLEHHDQNKAAFNWSRYPFTEGSYSCLVPGQVSTYWGSGPKPELNGRLLFAGEHVATDSFGYMNGACLSGRMAAQAVLAAAH